MPPYESLACSILIVHSSSLLFAISVLVLSFPDCGILSFCLNPILALITIGYNMTMLLLSYRRPKNAPILPVAYIIFAYLLALAWIAAFIAMATLLSCRKKETLLFGFHVIIPQTFRNTQKLQIMLDPVLFALLGNVAIKSTIDRYQHQYHNYQLKEPNGQDSEQDFETSRHSDEESASDINSLQEPVMNVGYN